MLAGRLFLYILGIHGILFIATSCYRMPTEEDFSIVPMTNNPSVTCERPSSVLPLPQAGY